jgi:hypothetical protein
MMNSCLKRSAVFSLLRVISFIFLTVSVCDAAVGTRAKSSTKAPPLPQEETIVIPQSILEFSRVADASVVTRNKNFEFAASTWAPQGLSSSSYNPSMTGTYQRGTVPMVTFNRWMSDGVTVYGFNASSKFGLSFNQLHRSGTVPVGGGTKATQMMNLFSTRVGVEIKPEADFWGWLSPFVSLSVLPSWAVFASSELSDGSSTGLLAMEEVAGFALQSPAFGKALGLNNIGLEIGVLAIQGLSGPSGLNGMGVMAGTRIEL